MDSQMISSNPGALDGQEISLGIPKRGTSDAYLIHMMNTLSAHRNLFANLQNITDVRIIPLTRTCIVSVLDDQVRRDLLKAYEHAIEYIQNSSGIDATEKGALVIQASQAVVGEVYSYLDEFIGLSKVNAILPVAEDPPEDDGPRFIKSTRRVSDGDDGIPAGTVVYEQNLDDGEEE